VHIRENDDAALLEPHIGAFLCVAERGFDTNPSFDKTAWRSFERTKCGPEGAKCRTPGVQIYLEQICTTAGSPNSKAQG